MDAPFLKRTQLKKTVQAAMKLRMNTYIERLKKNKETPPPVLIKGKNDDRY